MRLEGLLALIGIIIAVYALAQPVQRRSVRLLVPVWLVISSVIISASLLIWRYAVTIFCYRFYPWSDFASMISALVIPIIGVFIAFIYWQRAKLSAKKNKVFREFIQTSVKENKFDELLRILEKNEESVVDVLEQGTLDLIFERGLIENTISARNWLHLRLLSDEKLIKKLTDRSAASNNLMRTLVAAETSPLHSAIVAAYGGREHTRPTEVEWKLIDKTLQNPKWYMNVRADYPIIVHAYEKIASKEFDFAYNQKDDLYTTHQGESSRLRCPIYLALKTHVLMLKKAIEIKGEDDYYVSDLWDLFRNVCEHSQYDKNVWEDRDANWEYPTPFAFLMKEVLADLKNLCRENYKQGNLPPGRIGSDLIRTWATCIANLGYSRDKVSDNFKFECLGYCLSYTMKMKETYEGAEGERKENIKLWRDGLVEKLKRYRAGDERLREILFQSMNKLDYGKRHIWDYHKWLREELGLPERPSQAN